MKKEISAALLVASLTAFSQEKINHNGAFRTLQRPSYPETLYTPEKFVILAHKDFEAELKPYIEHKTKQGFEISTVFRNNEEQEALREKVVALKPHYILVVGDANRIPPFWGKELNTSGKTHNTDLQYSDFDLDGIPDAMLGRWPAESVAEVKRCIEKTLYMEKLPAEQFPLATRYVAVGQVGGGEQVNFCKDYLDQNKNLTKVACWLGASYLNETIEEMNKGAGFFFHAGHGYWNSWTNSISHANAYNLTNNNFFPFVASMSCLTADYNNSVGENFLVSPTGGAVGYIGATNLSSETHNYFMTEGWRDDYGNPRVPESIGLIASMYHIAGEGRNVWARTLGEIHFAAKESMRQMPVVSKNEKRPHISYYYRYHEIYILMGDPTYIPYTDTPTPISFACENTAGVGNPFPVKTASDARVALTQNGKILSTTISDETGKALLYVPADAQIGNATLAAIAQNHPFAEKEISIISAEKNKNSSAALKSLSLNGKEQTISQEISVKLPFDDAICQILATPDDENALVENIGTHDLQVGANVVKLKVTAADQTTTAIYTLNIELEENQKSTNADLKSLTMAGYDVLPGKDAWTYSVTVGNHFKMFKEVQDLLTVVPADPKARYEFDSDGYLADPGFCATILIHVYPETGSIYDRMSYSLQVYRQPASTSLNSILADPNSVSKTLENGQIIIHKNGEKFTVAGQKL